MSRAYIKMESYEEAEVNFRGRASQNPELREKAESTPYAEALIGTFSKPGKEKAGP